jgi:hypothetical protein
MKYETYDEERGWEGYFPEREKRDVVLAAPMDGFTAARKIPSQFRLRIAKGPSFTKGAG